MYNDHSHSGVAWDELPDRFTPSRRTLPQILSAQAAEYGDRTLAISGEYRFSFADAPEIAARAATRLREVGVGSGDRVAMLCSNRIEFLEVFLGAAWIGAVVVPLNTASRGAQLHHMLANSGAHVLVAEPEFAEQVLALDETELAVEAVLVVGEQDDRFGKLGSGLWRLAAEPADVVQSAPGDTIALLYTSGTTGLSKGVCCPHAQYFWWGFHGVQILGIESGDVLLTALPLFHTNALGAFFHALLTGSTLVVLKRFSASGFVSSVQEHRATVTYLLGAMVPILLAQQATNDDARHHVRVALAPGVPADAKAEFTDRFGIDLVDGFGSTESNFVIAEPRESKRRATMGIVRPGFEARVVDELDEDVADDTPGELVLRATEPFAFATGYHGMPEATVETWRNLWLHTGDRVSRDTDGYYRFIDRMKDAIRRRGENISSYEVEQVIAGHHEVAQVAVFPVRSELAEDEVMASVVLRDSAKLTPAELLDYCQPRLSYFALPRYLDFVDTLPMTSNGKIKKYPLRETGVTYSTWDREQHGYSVRR